MKDSVANKSVPRQKNEAHGLRELASAPARRSRREKNKNSPRKSVRDEIPTENQSEKTWDSNARTSDPLKKQKGIPYQDVKSSLFIDIDI
jgi:hypothetical protein